MDAVTGLLSWALMHKSTCHTLDCAVICGYYISGNGRDMVLHFENTTGTANRISIRILQWSYIRNEDLRTFRVLGT